MVLELTSPKDGDLRAWTLKRHKEGSHGALEGCLSSPAGFNHTVTSPVLSSSLWQKESKS